MANANTNLMQIQIRPTSKANSTSRTQAVNPNRANSNTRNYKSGTPARNEKSNFGTELDKANAQVNQSQQQSDEVQAAAETAESAPVDEIVKSSSHQNKNEHQGAPQQNNSNQNEENVPQAVSEKAMSENLVEDAVTEIISPTIQPQVTVEISADIPQNIPQDVPVDVQKNIPQNFAQHSAQNIPQDIPQNILRNISQNIPQDIPQNIDVEVVTENIPVQELTPTIPDAEIPLDVDKNISTQFENPTAQIKTDVPTDFVNPDEGVQDKIPDVAENLPTLATSADIALYFTTNTSNLLADNAPVVEVDTPNLMSIMPQAQDDKAQSMLNFLSGRTWQSVKSTENEVPVQNLNLQNLEPQSVQPAQTQTQVPFPIQPQFQPRPLNIQQVPVQPTEQTELQPTLNTQAPVQNFVQQPLNNQAPVQNFVQQPLNNQTPVQNFVQQPLNNQAPVQSFVQQPLNNQTPVQNFVQQPLNNQTPIQNFVQQPLTNQMPVQNFVQQPLTNQAPVQNFVQQPLNTQAPVQNFVQQPTMTNQTPLQTTVQIDSPTLQAQPQVQQQQFGGEIQPQVNSLQPQVEPKMVNRQAVNEFLGVPLQVEEGQPSTPIMPLQNISQQFEQNQRFTRNFQQNFSQFTTDVETQAKDQAVTSGTENFIGNMTAVNHTTQNQSAAQVQTPEMIQTPRDNFNIPTQIVEQARMIRNATNTEMVINLKPEHLGELTLRVSVSTNGAVNASFYSDNAQVRAIIENSIVQLKQELNDQGIKVDNVEVYAGLSEDGLLNGQGQQAWQQNQQRGRRGTINLETVEEEVEALSPANEGVSTDGGVDYKI